MPSSDSFDALIDRLRRGDNAAATEIYERFARQLIQQAQQRLVGRLRGKADPEDVVQSVFKSLYGRLQDGQFVLPNWDSLWGLLVQITLRKCGHRVEYFHAAKRDVRNEVSPGALPLNHPPHPHLRYGRHFWRGSDADSHLK